MNEKNSVFDYFGYQKQTSLTLSLLGEHQIENATLAIRTVEACKISPEHIREGLISAFIPGRFEIVQRDPTIIFDGAHNIEKMNALVIAICRIFPRKKIITILAIKTGKNARDIMEKILPISHEVILTAFHVTADLGETVSYLPHALQQIIKRVDFSKKTTIQGDPIKAITEAKQKASKDDIILVTGSLYLVGEVRRSFVAGH